MNLLFQVVLGLTLNPERRNETLNTILLLNQNNAYWFFNFYYPFKDKACKSTDNYKLKCAINLDNLKLKAELIAGG